MTPEVVDFDQFERQALAAMGTPANDDRATYDGSGIPNDPPPAAYKPRFKLVFWEDLDSEEEPHEFLIDDLITRGETAMLSGASQAGKTFVVLDMCMSVTRGTAFLGRFHTRQGGVVYQAGEGYKGLKSKRLKAYRKRFNLKTEDRLPFAIIGSPIDLYKDDADVDAFIADVRFAASHWTVPLELVVIDTLAKAATGANENASEDVSRILARCDKIRTALGCTVLLVHHMNADGTKSRGHTSIKANIENEIVCRLLENAHDRHGRKIRELEVTKQKDADNGQKIKFVLSSIEIGQDPRGKKVTSCTIEAPDYDEGQTDQAPTTQEPRLSNEAFTYLRTLEEALKSDGVVPAPREVRIRADIPVVSLKTVADRFAEAWFLEEPDPEEKLRKLAAARSKAGNQLGRLGYLGKQGDWLWRTEKRLPGSRKAHNTDDQAGSATSSDGWSAAADEADGTTNTAAGSGWSDLE